MKARILCSWLARTMPGMLWVLKNIWWMNKPLLREHSRLLSNSMAWVPFCCLELTFAGNCFVPAIGLSPWHELPYLSKYYYYKWGNWISKFSSLSQAVMAEPELLVCLVLRTPECGLLATHRAYSWCSRNLKGCTAELQEAIGDLYLSSYFSNLMNFPHEAGIHFMIVKRKRLIILNHLSTSHHQKVGTLKRDAVHGSSGSLDLSIPGNLVKSRRDVRIPVSDDSRKTPLRQAVRIATITRGSEGEDGRETFLHEYDGATSFLSEFWRRMDCKNASRLAHLSDATFATLCSVLELWQGSHFHPEATGRLFQDDPAPSLLGVGFCPCRV